MCRAQTLLLQSRDRVGPAVPSWVKVRDYSLSTSHTIAAALLFETTGNYLFETTTPYFDGPGPGHSNNRDNSTTHEDSGKS